MFTVLFATISGLGGKRFRTLSGALTGAIGPAGRGSGVGSHGGRTHGVHEDIEWNMEG